MLRKDRYKAFVDYFSTHQPEAVTELKYSNPYQLLISVILSAQCTDKRINQITPALFERFPNPQDLAVSTPEEVFEYIRSVSYPNNKAKHLVGMAKKLVEEFNIKLLIGDWTKRDEVIGSFLRKNGLVGVPAYFIQKKDCTLINLGETVTISSIKENLN